jgi:hypothetical protein
MVGAAGEVAGRDAYQRYVDDFRAANPANLGGAPDLSVFTASPDYQFNLSQGMESIRRQAAAGGGRFSGNTLAAGADYASGLASREYGAFVDRLLQQAGIGSTGIGASAAAGANAANNISAAHINAGNARASGIMAGAAGVNSALQGGLSNLLYARYAPQQGG